MRARADITRSSWESMRTRCSNPNASNWKYYGGKGVRVCPQWSRYEQFLLDMGPRPSLDYTIDREDANGDYEPGNCSWATKKQQGRNRAYCKLTEVLATQMRTDYAADPSRGAFNRLARKYGVGHVTVRNVINGTQWA